MITLSINLDKIDDRHVIQGKAGRYLNLTVLDRDFKDDYGNDYMVVQGVSKECRERGDRGPILGNGKYIEVARRAPRPGNRPGSTRPPATSGPDPADEEINRKFEKSQPKPDDEIPF